ncbi:MAG: substrate-binding domain-containing protein [Planctomycetaceae bacterium]|nr:substrate-binding domain-containing protein [Planctomycetaceae bacterium]
MPKKPHEIAISIEPTSDNNQRIIRGALNYLATQPDLRVFKHLAIPYLDWESSLRWKGAGLITAAETPGALEKLFPSSTHLVSVSLHQSPLEGVVTVGADNVKIGWQAAEHLLLAGLRHFVFVGRLDWYHNQERWKGFQRRLQTNGLDVRQIELAFVRGQNEILTGAYHNVGHYDLEQLAKQLEQLKFPVGIFAAHDEFADAVIEVCRRLSLRVPYDVAVIGVNNYRLVCDSCDPPLTSIPQSAERIGFEAAGLLHRLIAGDSIEKKLVLFPPQPVVIRRSTDFLAIEDEDVVSAVRFIRAHSHESITTARVVEEVLVGRKTLDNRFREFLGHPVAEEIRLTKLRRAKGLLTNTDMPIATVGFDCGFSSTSGFVRAFREATGKTPRQYQKGYRIPNQKD